MKKILSVNLKHPTRKFRLGKHVISIHKNEYDLDENEQKELASVGAQKWIVKHEEKSLEVQDDELEIEPKKRGRKPKQ